MTFLRALATLLRLRDFRRLFVSRVTSQGSDGIFQVALASHVLFNPEKAADARSIAIAFAVVLLPYSLLGPFVGVLLDRWPRRQVIVVSQLIRVAAMLTVALLVTGSDSGPFFFGAVLVVFSLNRLILAGFGAALPHVVTRDLLVSANSVAPTCGSFAYLIGGAVGTGLRAIGTDLLVALVAAGAVLVAAWAASRLPFVGPDDEPERTVREVLGSVVEGLVEAAHTFPRRAWVLLTLVFVTRVPMGLLLLQSLLLFRGPFGEAMGAAGVVAAAAASAVGFSLAAFVTPWLSPRLSQIPYAVRNLALGGLTCAALGPFLAPWSILVVAFVVAFASQCIKITVDSLMQAHVPDQLLGRAFSVYDMVYNAGLVAAAALGALTLPESGLAWWPLLGLAVLYAVAAWSLSPVWRWASRLDRTRPLG
ncbi:MFS transporter [Intrasporangium oryzae NRRL B-24470]|uniref:MFS transporter n=1 Tax=Intrasporangium oryzae NRRL B-24470 TaxID=1386089 RepID=W9GAB2_9MICO|nr:MFS transporter [Intrasporangium oryzae]EWT01778.1 MFS transporter [Intrasporangium oryzae NRRL B-24470]